MGSLISNVLGSEAALSAFAAALFPALQALNGYFGISQRMEFGALARRLSRYSLEKEDQTGLIIKHLEMIDALVVLVEMEKAMPERRRARSAWWAQLTGGFAVVVVVILLVVYTQPEGPNLWSAWERFDQWFPVIAALVLFLGFCLATFIARKDASAALPDRVARTPGQAGKSADLEHGETSLSSSNEGGEAGSSANESSGGSAVLSRDYSAAKIALRLRAAFSNLAHHVFTTLDEQMGLSSDELAEKIREVEERRRRNAWWRKVGRGIGRRFPSRRKSKEE